VIPADVIPVEATAIPTGAPVTAPVTAIPTGAQDPLETLETPDLTATDPPGDQTDLTDETDPAKIAQIK